MKIIISPALLMLLLAGCATPAASPGSMVQQGPLQITLTSGQWEAVRDHCSLAMGEPVRSCAYVTRRACSVVVPAPAAAGDWRAYELLGREIANCFTGGR